MGLLRDRMGPSPSSWSAGLQRLCKQVVLFGSKTATLVTRHNIPHKADVKQSL